MVWIQKEEYRYYTQTAWQPGGDHDGIDPDDIVELVKLNTEGGCISWMATTSSFSPESAPTPGGGTPTPPNIFAWTASPPFVLASDNVYLYRNLSEHKPSATFTRGRLSGQSRCPAAHDRARGLRGSHRSGARRAAVSEISHRGARCDDALSGLRRSRSSDERIGLSREVVVERADEGPRVTPVVATGARKQGHAGAKFEIVGGTQDLVDRAPLDVINRLGREPQARPENRMIER